MGWTLYGLDRERLAKRRRFMLANSLPRACDLSLFGCCQKNRRVFSEEKTSSTTLLGRNNDSHGHINRYLKLLPSTLKHLLLLSVCPPKLSGAIFLFPTIAMSSVSGCDGFCFNRNQSLAHPYLGKFPHFDECFSNGLKPAHHSSPVFVLLSCL